MFKQSCPVTKTRLKFPWVARKNIFFKKMKIKTMLVFICKQNKISFCLTVYLFLEIVLKKNNFKVKVRLYYAAICFITSSVSQIDTNDALLFLSICFLVSTTNCQSWGDLLYLNGRCAVCNLLNSPYVLHALSMVFIKVSAVLFVAVAA